ncbi:MAG: conjugal transfer protein TraF, partial [Proteobacteria bacterium]|nr:conjugal transfer protein TraF [Pseudomonadota bacterium]
MKKLLLILTIFTLLFSLSLNASYQNLFEGYGSQASNGPGTLFYNPAMLGYKYAPMLDINILKLELEGTNNFMSIDLWNKYTVKDTLKQADKDTLLINIPSSGWLIHQRVNANVLGLKIGGFAIAPRIVEGVNTNFSKDLIDLGLNGNQLGKIYDFSTSDYGAILYGEVSVGYGQPIKLNNNHNLYVGGSFSYLYGVAYFDVTKNTAYFNSDSNFYQSTDTVSFRLCMNPKGNPGFGMNLGFAYDISNTFTAGISLKNAYSFINWNADSMDFSDSSDVWNNGAIYTGTGVVNLDSINIYKLIDMYLSGDSINGDSVFNKFIDTTFSTSYDPFTTHLPPILNIGGVWRGIYSPWKLSFNYEQGFSNTALSTVIPKFTLEGEYAFGRFLPVRAGIGIGGKELLEYSMGLGLDLPFAYFDIGASNHRGLFYGMKGISAELNFGFRSPIWSNISGTVKDSITGKPLVVDYTVT